MMVTIMIDNITSESTVLSAKLFVIPINISNTKLSIAMSHRNNVENHPPLLTGASQGQFHEIGVAAEQL